jgi:hypothetical protein
MGRGGVAGLIEERKNFFFEKKAPRPGKQKTSINLELWRWKQHGPNRIKSFLLLFFKKEVLSFCFPYSCSSAG